jgi:hypothetical protein
MVPLILGILFLSSLGMGLSHQVDATPAYKTRLINSFETGVEESTPYGSWVKSAQVVGVGTASVTQTNTQQYHGTYSADMYVLSSGGPMAWAEAKMTFTSNNSLGYYMFDTIGIVYKLSVISAPVYAMSEFMQWNGSTWLDTRTDVLSGSGWKSLVMSPIWDSSATRFTWEISVFTDIGTGLEGDLYLDMFYCTSSSADVRVRYWNLYTGLGYYAEKLLAKYYTISDGWVDIWRNEFQAFKGDDILIQVTDVFGRNVWTGIVHIASDPVYVDILVPIITVEIVKPDWYNDSVPWEWRITCLPWGPDGTQGMSLPAIGFEFEVLAGWYSISWLRQQEVNAGNRTIYIDGNTTSNRSFMITDLSIPINPDYQVEIEGDDHRLYKLSNFNDLIAFLAALYDSNYVKVALLVSGTVSIALLIRQVNKQKIRQMTGRGP